MQLSTNTIFFFVLWRSLDNCLKQVGSHCDLYASILKCCSEVITPEEPDKEITAEVSNLCIKVLRSLFQCHEGQDVIVHVSKVEYDVSKYVYHYNDRYSEHFFLCQFTIRYGIVSDEDLQESKGTTECHSVWELKNWLYFIHIVNVIIWPAVRQWVCKEEIFDGLVNLSDVASTAIWQTLVGEDIDHSVSETIDKVLSIRPCIKVWEGNFDFRVQSWCFLIAIFFNFINCFSDVAHLYLYFLLDWVWFLLEWFHKCSKSSCLQSNFC